jgi:hypothetical protein
MDALNLTVEQEEEAQRIADILIGAAGAELRQVARLLVSKQNRELFGETEFVVRDAIHRLGARAFDAALSERKKGGTKGRRRSARTAAGTPNSTATDPAT